MNVPRGWVATAVVVTTILFAGLLTGRGTSERRPAASEVESDPPASTARRGEESRRGADLSASPETATGPMPVEIDVLPHTEGDVVDLDTDTLVCRFRARLAGFEAGDTEGILTGETRGMLAIHGSDSVTVVDRRWDRPVGASPESR